MSTARQVAEGIVLDAGPRFKGTVADDARSRAGLIDAIESALLAQIEECAKVAETTPIYSRKCIATAIRSLSNRGRG